MIKDILDTHTHTLATPTAPFGKMPMRLPKRAWSFWLSRSMPPDCGEAARPFIFKICVW